VNDRTREAAELAFANAANEHAALIGIGYALLNVAEAIREQTAAMQTGGILVSKG
jgi:hypothetical protein